MFSSIISRAAFTFAATRQFGGSRPQLVKLGGMVAGVPSPVTSHLSLVPMVLSQTLSPGDVAVDATAGNGYDSLSLARLCLSEDEAGTGRVLAIDVQKRAIEMTQSRLLSEFDKDLIGSRVSFFEMNHRDLTPLDRFIPPEGARAFVYNLGYLPGGDKTMTTLVEDTLRSLRSAAERTALGGIICVTCYRGHAGGAEETALVREELVKLPQSDWRVVEHTPLNWPASPILITAHRFEVSLPQVNSLI